MFTINEVKNEKIIASIKKMEKYYKTLKTKKNNIESLEFQILSWWDHDTTKIEEDEDDNNEDEDEVESLEYIIKCFGATKTGESVECSIEGFNPFYYIKLPESCISTRKVNAILDYIEQSWILKKIKDPLDRKNCGIVQRKDILGFNNNTQYSFCKLVFTSKKAFSKSRYIFKKAVDIAGIVKNYKFKLYESTLDPYIKYASISNIKMAGWISVDNIKRTRESTCNYSIKVKKENVKVMDSHETGNFLQASWDIEVYSYDYAFPSAFKKVENVYPNEIIQIGTTFKYTKDSNVLVKHLFTLKDCDKIDDPDTIVECCKTEKELIERWVEMIRKVDPDIMYTYNGDCFDYVYLMDRCSLPHINLVKKANSGGYSGWILNNLSRLHDIPSVMKKEKFSSSAYGDSEFNRVYIPGRLNYDLMIHYKRGMKKYDSYKLENIASNILGEGKHDVSAIDIFKKYEIGKSSDIKLIGEYCIQDTHLLQKLVDKQLILESALQLANVTFVPVNFLLTRGQTIKVLSQISRKANEMGFVVPDTNFNENDYPVLIRSEMPMPFTHLDIGKYATIECNGQIQLAEPPMYPKRNIECKIVELGTPNDRGEITSVICKCDLDIVESMYNLRGKFGNTRVKIKSIGPIESENDVGFTGATVLEPKTGCYYDDISVLDFASLYPTIIMGYNLDYSTFVGDTIYDNLDGVEYLTLEWDDKQSIKVNGTCKQEIKSGKRKGEECGKPAIYIENETEYYCRVHDPLKKTRSESEKENNRSVHYKYTIVQKHKNEKGEWVNKGVLPALLEELYTARKWAKKKMSEAKNQGDKNAENNYNALQLATKVSLNSCYGFLGRSSGNLVKKELAQLVTYCGRKMIDETKEYMENEFGEMVKRENLLEHTIKLQ